MIGVGTFDIMVEGDLTGFDISEPQYNVLDISAESVQDTTMAFIGPWNLEETRSVRAVEYDEIGR